MAHARTVLTRGRAFPSAPAPLGTDVGGTDLEGRGLWLTISEAAEHLRMSEITIRRGIKRGLFDATRVSTPHGPQWLVWCEHARIGGDA